MDTDVAAAAFSPRRRKVIAALATTLLFAAGHVTGIGSSPAVALDGSQFDPGLIITDANFYDPDGMTEPEIQTFLNQKIGTCKNSLCLNVLTQNTYSRAADRTVCQAYEGAVGESAARLIYKVQKACGISAKVILVTLQKEMGLITNKAPRIGELNAAMGYACPDSSPCNSDQAGFYNQIYMAAWQFKRYSTPDIFGRYFAGGGFNIQYHPNAGCGVRWVSIANRATAALYNYTPYTPNDDALSNLHGAAPRDPACGSYGNRNFWVYYNDWFGNPLDIHPQGIDVTRLSGEGRVETAVDVSQSIYPTRVDTVYVANAMNFPDALSAGPAAATQGAPLLLVMPNALDAGVRREIERLAPTTIVVVGSAGVVSDAVFAELSSLAPTIRRDGGEDRYETSRAIAQSSFAATGSTLAYIATGESFADALSASAAAGSKKAPVILVRGSATSVAPETRALLTQLGVTTVHIVGGTGVVSEGIAADLATVPGVTSVLRAAGTDRYATSRIVNREAFGSAPSVFVASGLVFPDGLVGAAVAGAKNSPLYLVPGGCMPHAMLQDLVDYGTTSLTILGGTGVVSSGAAAFANCQ